MGVALWGVVFGLSGSPPAVFASTPPTTGDIKVVAHSPLRLLGVKENSSANVLSIRPDFISATTGWIADKRGLLKTVNGGAAWSSMPTPKGTVQAVAFSSSQTGWVLMATQLPTSSIAASQTGSFTLYRTTDGGSRWQKEWAGTLPDSLQTNVVGLQALSDRSVILHMGNRLLITHNAGLKWQSVRFPGQSIAAINFLSPQTGTVVTISITEADGPDRLSIWQTTDSGKHFTRTFQSKNAYFTDVQLGEEQHQGVVLAWDTMSWDTRLFWTKNSGKSWTATAKPLIDGRVFPDQPVFLSVSHVLLPAGGGAGPLPSSLWASNDGGEHFHPLNTLADWRQLQLSRAFSSTVYGLSTAGNGNQLLKSTNDGRSWAQVYPSLRPTENISFVSATHGFGLGTETNPTAVLITTDGGTSWRVVGELPIGSQISALAFSNTRDGLAVADQPRSPQLQVYRTIDGGHTWHLVKRGELPKATDPVIAKMGLIDPATLTVFSSQNWLLGANGYPQLFTLATKNAGQSWSLVAQMADPPGAVEDFAFASPTNGWMSLLKTEKSGITPPSTTIERLDAAGHSWRAAWKLPAGVGIEGIARDGVKDGWLIGVVPWLSMKQRMVVYRTTSGGNSWQVYTSPVVGGAWPISPPPNLTNVYPVDFVNAKDGWLLTQNGLLQTTSGGQTWKNPVLAK